jgi:aspartate aminotransferase
LITPRTKAIIVNSPCNPTGATYDRKTLEAIADIAVRHQLLIISDEIYEKVLYDGATHMSIATLSPEVAAQTVIINGVSKAYAMTGWRIGYAAGPKDILTAMANIQSQSTSNPCSISQKAAVAALKLGGPFTEKMVAEFDRRRKVMVGRLNTMPGVTCRMPTGAFYAFPNIGGILGRRGPTGPIASPHELAQYLLKDVHVAVVPGEPFGSQQHIRLSYATSMESIERGMDRIAAAFGKLTT